jgi:tRNA-dihydrouridine synthase 3
MVEKHARDNEEAGRLRVKEQYRVERDKKLKQEEPLICIPTDSRDNHNNNNNNNNKSKGKKRDRGQNKSRHVKKSFDKVNICVMIAMGSECTRENCKSSHDLALYLESKEPDVGDSCPLYEAYNICRFGLKCRFSDSHKRFQENPKPAIPESECIKNITPSDFQRLLRHKQYPMPRAQEFEKWWTLVGQKESFVENDKKEDECLNDDSKTLDLNQVQVEVTAGNVEKVAQVESVKNELTEEPITVQKNQQTDIVDENANAIEPTEKPSQVEHVDENADATTLNEETTPKEPYENSVKPTLPSDFQNVDECLNEAIIKLTPREKKKLDFKGKSYLAPLTTVGNLPFRRICKEYGVDITCGEMALTHSLMQGGSHEWAIFKKHKSEDFFGIQVTGNLPVQFAEACDLIGQNLEIDFLDLNLGCPIDLVCNKGAGSALMTRRNRLRGVIMAAEHCLDCPVTVKLRTGITEKRIAHRLIPLFESWGVAAVTLHGRSKQQRYTKLADWDYISQCADITNPEKMAFFGNGDILGPGEYNQHLSENPNFSGMMIGRGALIKPWIFQELKTGQLYDISSSERLDVLRKFGKFGMEHWYFFI